MQISKGSNSTPQVQAFEWLEKDLQNKETVAMIRYYIAFESLRDAPRCKDMLKRMGLSE